MPAEYPSVSSRIPMTRGLRVQGEMFEEEHRKSLQVKVNRKTTAPFKISQNLKSEQSKSKYEQGHFESEENKALKYALKLKNYALD